MASTRYPKAKWLGQTPNNSGKFKAGQPKFLVCHYTAGAAALDSAKHLMNPAAKASAPFVVDRDGVVIQISEIDIINWHAGKSFWRGIDGLNGFSIGIEFANYGFMRKVNGKWMTGVSDYKSVYRGTNGVIEGAHKNDPGRIQGWEVYTAAQIASGKELTKWVLAQFPTIKEIVGHDDISPGRKSDPGPAFPMAQFKDLLLGVGNEDPDPKLTVYVVNATTLNVRGGPGTNFETLKSGPLKKGAKVQLLKEDGVWSFVEFKGSVQGWVASQYITPT